MGVDISCGADCADGSAGMTIEYSPKFESATRLPSTPAAVTSMCFYGNDANKASINATVGVATATLSLSQVQALANMTMPKVECVYDKRASGAAYETTIPPGYACTMTELPWCSPMIDLDFQITFTSGNPKVKSMTLPMPCHQSR
jgi:hypothetical protein